MKFVIFMFQLEWMVTRLMEHRVVANLAVRLFRVMASAVEHITCETFSSPSEWVVSSTSVFIDNVMHASCDVCHSMLCENWS